MPATAQPLTPLGSRWTVLRTTGGESSKRFASGETQVNS